MWSDQETTQDCLGFEAYVDSLATVCVAPNIAPLTLGVFGSWGSGKTSLMKMLELRFESNTRVKTVWANAWRYEGKEEMQSALVHAILASVIKDKTLSDEFKEILKRLKRGTSVLKLGKFLGKTLLTMTPDINSLIDCFEKESGELAKTMAQFEQDFEALLKETDLDRVVVFIDDLDRCQSDKVVETFETIKLFLGIPECTFVIGADPAKIEHAIEDHYKLDKKDMDLNLGDRGFADDYMEKIVQVPFRIPEQTFPNIACYVGMLVLQNELTDEAWLSLVESRNLIVSHSTGVDAGFFDWLREQPRASFLNGVRETRKVLRRTQPFISILAHGLRGNPRQIKRFLNILNLRKLLAESNKLEVVEEVLVKILVLEYTWREFFTDVASNCGADDGRSELLNECKRWRKEKFEVLDSPILAKAVESPGLQEFLAQKPYLDTVDLRPYLFLAQTALQLPSPTLIPPDETVLGLVETITQEDRIRSRASARETARMDSSMAAAVARLLASKLNNVTSPVIQVNIVNALRTIGEKHASIFPDTINSLHDFDAPRSQAFALVVLPLLDLAEENNFNVKDLRHKFEKVSKLAAALTNRKERSNRVKQSETT
ncbi:MAG: hypothetical protein F4Z01_07635 [Gammaproteobacteria bacterium]|nr:hypothetical protein [Gammaproteobacteria bacterium]MYF37929.1 hypothetical protein [Gammaproteobacteria bacterium]